MTKRTVLIGIIFAVVIICGGYFNDEYMQQTYMVGNHLPIFVFGILALIVIGINPLLSKIKKYSVFSVKELLVIVAFMCAVCCIPNSGFFRTFAPTILLPTHYEKLSPSWQENQVLNYMPKNLMVDPSEDEEHILGDYLKGISTATTHAYLVDIPWKPWLMPSIKWLSMFAFLMIALIGLSLIFHRQWSTYERLAYPIAEFTSFLLGAKKDSQTSSLLKNRIFWIGFFPPFIMYGINGLQIWFQTFIYIPTRINMWPLMILFPKMSQIEGFSSLVDPIIYPAAIAFAYFLPSDVTLAIGVSHFTYLFVAGTCLNYGIGLTNVFNGAGTMQGLQFGAYLGMTLILLYTGRAYYLKVFLSSIGISNKESKLESSSVWGFRIFIVASTIFTILMVREGLAWPFSFAITIMLIIMFTVLSRISAETGMFFVQSFWWPGGILLGLCGTVALGPNMLAIVLLISIIISIDPRESLMPFVVNLLRVSDDSSLPKGKIASLIGSCVVLGLIVGFVFILWIQYDRGVPMTDVWATYLTPKMTPDILDKEIQLLKANAEFEKAVSLSLKERLLNIKPAKDFLYSIISGFILFMLCAFLRLRISKWPLHPVIFLIWLTYPARAFAFSFFMGWVVKTIVVKFGGGSTYQNLKPLMIGIITGTLLIGLVFMVVGAIYNFITGFVPPGYWIFPG